MGETGTALRVAGPPRRRRNMRIAEQPWARPPPSDERRQKRRADVPAKGRLGELTCWRIGGLAEERSGEPGELGERPADGCKGELLPRPLG